MIFGPDVFAEAYLTELRKSNPSHLTLCSLRTQSDRDLLAAQIKDAYEHYQRSEQGLLLESSQPGASVLFLRDFVQKSVEAAIPKYEHAENLECEEETEFFDQAIPDFLAHFFSAQPA